jgi:hypothetical protein
MMDGMRWMMDGMGLIGFLVLVVLILAAAALVKISAGEPLVAGLPLA